MPQEITVAQCFSCKTFQTKIATVSKKWTCKLCNEKQSLKKTFGTGSGKECRELVQKLNQKHAEEAEKCQEERAQQLEDEYETDWCQELEDMEDQGQPESMECPQNEGRGEETQHKIVSKWDKYLDNTDVEESRS